jgi:hypothetical protein
MTPPPIIETPVLTRSLPALREAAEALKWWAGLYITCSARKLFGPARNVICPGGIGNGLDRRSMLVDKGGRAATLATLGELVWKARFRRAIAPSLDSIHAKILRETKVYATPAFDEQSFILNPTLATHVGEMIERGVVTIENDRTAIETFADWLASWPEPRKTKLFSSLQLLGQVCPERCRFAPRFIHFWITLVQVGPFAALLGADLEETGNPQTGWTPIVQSTARPGAMSQMFKVPHRGSENGHCRRSDWQRGPGMA